MADLRWYFTKEELYNTPSRRCGIDAEKELLYRHQGAKLIQDMGRRLQLTQLVINTAIVYMHRFYMFHTFTRFHRNCIGPAALFLAAKVEEQPRKLEHVIKAAHYMLCHHEHSTLDIQSEAYLEKAQELVINENILLQTLGFDVAIDHPHTHVIKGFQMFFKSSYNDQSSSQATELVKASYLLATNSLHLTTMCLQYKPAVVACACIHFVCKWSNNEIQRLSEGRDWFCIVDPTVTLELLEQLAAELLAVHDKYPNRLKKMNSSGSGTSGLSERGGRHASSLALNIRNSALASQAVRSHELAVAKSGSSKTVVQSSAPKTVLTHKEYSEKKERERREREKERERVEHRERHHSSSATVPSSGHQQQQLQPSSNNSAATHAPNVSHSRSQQQEGVKMLRKLPADPRPVSQVAGNRGGVPFATHPHSQLQHPAAIKKEYLPVKTEDRLGEKQDRTSDNAVINSSKVVSYSDKYKSGLENRHLHTSDWNQCKQSDNTVRERKIEVKSEIKTELGLKESVEIKSDLKVIENKSDCLKSEQSVRIRTEAKEVGKSEPPEEIKPNSSFIFSSSFSLRDFLNPSDLPPEDIFDTELDSKSLVTNPEYLQSSPTHHPKLRATPKPIAAVPLMQPFSVPSSIPSVTTKENEISSEKKSQDTLLHFNNADSELEDKGPITNPSASRDGNSIAEKSVTGSSEKSSIGSSSSSSSVGNHNLRTSKQSPLKRRRDKSKSPHPVSSVSKPKLKNVFCEPKVVLTNISAEEVKQYTKSHTSVSQRIPQTEGLKSVGVSNVVVTAAAASRTPADKLVSSVNHQQPSIISSMKEVVSLQESVNNNSNTSLKVRLARPENCDGNNLSSVTSANVPLLTTSMVPHLSSKKHKRKHSHHRRKEKKKHKHKEKDTCKDKEAKELSKIKKHKKHKEKEKDREKVKNDITPLKITLFRGKGVYTPEAGSVVSQSHTPVVANNTHITPTIDTPARIKLTISRSRLQTDSSPNAPVSPPRGLPPREKITPKVKLKKIQKDKVENESRKRERSPGGNVQPSKIARSCSSHNAPQVLASTHWSSQRQ